MEGTKSYFKFKRVNVEEGKMPVLKVDAILEKGEYVNDGGRSLTFVAKEEEETVIIRSGYLSPFRGYKFQVSGTEDGDWDLGSSKVIGLANIDYFRKGSGFSPYASNADRYDAIIELFKGQAMLALNEFYGAKITRKEIKTLDDFCEECVDYINKICGTHAA